MASLARPTGRWSGARPSGLLGRLDRDTVAGARAARSSRRPVSGGRRALRSSWRYGERARRSVRRSRRAAAIGYIAAKPTTLARLRSLERRKLNRLIAMGSSDDASGHVEPTLYLTAALTGLVAASRSVCGWWRDGRFARIQQIKRLSILGRELAQAAGELPRTPRAAVDAVHGETPERLDDSQPTDAAGAERRGRGQAAGSMNP
jgi:hypothetical protein